MQMTYPAELQRQIELAFILEATIPKEQCTSRYKDIGPKQKHEYFVISALNSGKYFLQLAERINERQAQPAKFYDLAYNALTDSQRSRGGKIVNYGLLEAMFPVAAAKCIYCHSGSETLELVPEVLRNTSKEDVEYVAKMRETIYTRSDKAFKRSFPFHTEGENVLEHYMHHQTVAHQASMLFVSELIQGMPLTRTIYESITLEEGSLAERVNEGFMKARGMSTLPYGALADFTAAALYLLISDNPERQIF